MFTTPVPPWPMYFTAVPFAMNWDEPLRVIVKFVPADSAKLKAPLPVIVN